MLAGVVFALPMLLSGELYFRDWGNHLFLVAKQARAIEVNHSPTIFLSTTERGWFYPFFAFYGATLYAAVGAVAAAVRSAGAAYVGSYAIAAASAFGGWVWLAWQAGLRSWMLGLPGAVYLGGAYYVTNAYGRGAWPELVAISFLPMVLAGAWSNLTRPRMTPWSIVGLAAPIVLMTGSHTITLVFSVPFVALAVLVAMLIWWREVRGVGRVAAVGAVALLAVGVNAWFLAPLLAYRDTLRVQPAEKLEWRGFDELDVIFSVLQTNPYDWSTPQHYVQAPLIPLLMSVVIVLWGVAVCRRPRLAMAAVALHLGFFGVLALITGTDIWEWLPREAHIVQFPYRLNSYLLACICGFVTLGAVYAYRLRSARPRAARLAQAALLGATLVQVGLGSYQVWTARTFGPIEDVLGDVDQSPTTWYEPLGYANISKRAFPAERLPLVEATGESLESLELEVAIPADLDADLARVNVFYSPFIAAEPDRIEGQARGHVVVSVPDNPLRRQLRIVTRDTPATLVGRWISLGSLLGLVVAVAVTGKAQLRGYAALARRRSGLPNWVFAPTSRG
jgi:hypothetical protein